MAPNRKNRFGEELDVDLCLLRYPGLTNVQTRAKIVCQNYRMEMPKECPKQIAALLLTCWDKDPTKRPDFAKIHRTLKELKDRSQQGGVAT